MLRPAIGQMLNDKQSYYSLVVGIAKRARQIVDEKNEEKVIIVDKPVRTAVEEFAAHKFTILDEEENNENNEDNSQKTELE